MARKKKTECLMNETILQSRRNTIRKRGKQRDRQTGEIDFEIQVDLMETKIKPTQTKKLIMQIYVGKIKHSEEPGSFY